jgi:hypothetical protein
MDNINEDMENAKDNLITAKTSQVFHANKKRREEDVYKVGDKVMLNMLHRCKEYLNSNPNRVTKFLP